MLVKNFPELVEVAFRIVGVLLYVVASGGRQPKNKE